MRAVRIETTGGSDVLSLADIADPVPGPRQVVVDVAAAGVNFIDTYQRSGLYPLDLPATLGIEGAGTVATFGEDTDGVGVGDRVCWARAQGSYAGRVVVDVDQLVPVPDGVELTDAAALVVQGLTAHFLVTDCYRLGSGERCLIHAAAGGVGQLLVQLAKRRGAVVFATAGGAQKVDLVASLGADHVIDYLAADFVGEVERIAGPRAIDVIYDGVGAATFAGGLALLRRRGFMVSFGNASGPVEPVAPLELSRNGSLFLTRPTLFDYVAEPEELRRRANDLFAWLGDGSLRLQIGQTYPLAEVRAAHDDLERRATVGKILLVP